MVCSQNITHLCYLNAVDTIINFCCSLPHLESFTTKWNTVMEGASLGLPSSVNEAQLLKLMIPELKEELILAKKALSLPLLEPLTKERLRRLTSLAMGCLLSALSVATCHSIFAAAATAPTKSAINSSGATVSSKGPASSTPTGSNREDDGDNCAIVVVETAVEVYQTLRSIIQHSPRSERIYYENFLYLAAWVLLTGLNGQLVSISQVNTWFFFHLIILISFSNSNEIIYRIWIELWCWL